jgi:predicted hydrolase (HD superfamily)
MNRQQTLDYINETTKNKNLVKHMLAVEAEMRGLAKYFNEDEESWGLAGLVHDADYEKMQTLHPSPEFFKELEKRGYDQKIVAAVKAHGWKFQAGLPEPQTKMEWALYCCDELSGLIIACALVRPDKKLTSVTLESIKKKWGQKAFAAGVNRTQAELCEEKLGIKLDEFILICLKSLQAIAPDLGL